MDIVKASLTPYSLMFREGGSYVSSVAALSSVDHRLLNVTLKNGLNGVGEIARYPPLNTSETELLENAAVKEIENIDFNQVPTVINDWRCRGPAMRGITFALDCVWHDIVSKQTGLPISVLLGGPAGGEVPEILSLSAGTKDELVEQIKKDECARRTIQIKLGIGDITSDIETVESILGDLEEEQLLLADFNGALSLTTALDVLPSLNDPKLIWEEPCRSFEDNAVVSRKLNGRMMFDTCLTDLDTFSRAINAGATRVVIKPALLGGLSVAKVARDISIAAGIKIRVDGPWSGQIAAHAALSLAIAISADQMIGSIDLTEPLETPKNWILKSKPGWVGIGDIKS